MSDYQHLTRHSPSTGSGSPDIWGIYEADTGSVQYVMACPETKKAALIDVVLNFDPRSARTSTESAEKVLELVKEQKLELVRILDTHPHADHMLAAAWLKEQTGLPNAIGARTKKIAQLWRDYYNLPDLDPAPHFDAFFEDGDSFDIGNLTVTVELSTGHTLGSISYFSGDAGFVHDTLMFPDSGSSRADFPGGSAAELWDSIQSILSRPDDTRLFVGHDYGKGDRKEPAWEATVAEHKAQNIHVNAKTDKATFIKTREERDATLALPDRILHALQVNLRGGVLPPKEDDGHSYFKIPANRF
ncbi:MBL fold metallo-hydrolase [Oceaniovalibus sp. ACAM 378]|uniref:MBL fold metallo-hydrolase n=1 Tax=Oceaniovalibus sp. ACAM 378 TaxID=2599923 RepID=UPI0011DA95B7|nr:MBL fold metallo-hydrolase [Oceaniovalibus sp. ACAM 378]TYB87946.1 MBL fold metallo-hydrolase [Oceaniovalibus sp. ACAM 378]